MSKQKPKTYTRAIKLKIYPTNKKRNIVKNIIEQYKHVVNEYLKIFYHKNVIPKLDKDTLALISKTELTERYKSQALKQAIEVYKSCENKKVKTDHKIPYFNGYPILDAKFVTIKHGEKSFDTVIKLSTLVRKKQIYIPSKGTNVLNKWIKKGGWLVNGCELHEDYIICYVKLEKGRWKTENEGKSLAIDLGMRKLVTTNEGNFFGTKFSNILDKIVRREKGSIRYKKALKERDNFINYVLKQICFDKLYVLFYENLKNMKLGKKGFRKNNAFRKRQQYWTYSRIITRILQLCEENRVRPIYINPKNTSRECPNCNNIASGNRILELFCCLTCGYTHDADIVGATNIFRKGMCYLRSLESLNLQKS
jgi:transposase